MVSPVWLAWCHPDLPGMSRRGGFPHPTVTPRQPLAPCRPYPDGARGVPRGGD